MAPAEQLGAWIEGATQRGVLDDDSLGMAMFGDPEPWMTTIGHGPASTPVRLFAS